MVTCAQAATVDEVAHAAAGVLSSLGHRRAHFVGHSYGTFVISRVCQLYPDVRPHWILSPLEL